MSPAEEIKSRLDIAEVLGEYISLRPAGANLRAVCPFHQEKTPSFMVSPEKQIWHCFGCDKGGDIFGFVMEMEGLTFSETLKLLAPKAGVVLKATDIETGSKRNRLLDVMAAAAEFYQRAMLNNAGVKNYLKGRGLTEDGVRTWEIGYSPASWDDLYNYLRSKSYTDEDIFLAGLSVRKEGTSKYYNRFRDRVMFPINDISGNVIAFTARINPENKDSDAQKMGKYINSPQTPIYDKGHVLFGLDKAKAAIKAEDLVVVVEGQMDVISLHQAGYKNTVASSGTALTSDQIKLIRRYTNNIALAFDADAAGQLAADRGIIEALNQELNVKIIIIPSGKDPDECVRENPAAWAAAVKNAQPMMEYYFTKVCADLDINKVEDKRAAVKKMLTMIMKLANRVEMDHWLKKMSEKINVEENILRETLKATLAEIKKPKELNPTRRPVMTVVLASESREEKLSELLLALMLKYPDFIPYTANNLESEYLAGAAQLLFYNELIIYYNDNSQIEYRSFRAHLEKKAVDQVALLDTLSLLADKDFADTAAGQVKSEIIKVILALKKHYFKDKMKETEKSIAAAEARGDSERINALMQDLKNLSEKSREFDI